MSNPLERFIDVPEPTRQQKADATRIVMSHIHCWLRSEPDDMGQAGIEEEMKRIYERLEKRLMQLEARTDDK